MSLNSKNLIEVREDNKRDEKKRRERKEETNDVNEKSKRYIPCNEPFPKNDNAASIPLTIPLAFTFVN